MLIGLQLGAHATGNAVIVPVVGNKNQQGIPPQAKHYEALAHVEAFRRRLTLRPAVDMAMHRRTDVPAEWRRDNPGEPPSSYLYDWLGDQLQLAAGMTVLDVGCGFGSALNRMARTLDINGLGITNSSSQATIGNRTLETRPTVSLQVGSFDRAFHGQFDAAIAVESLVHARSLDTTLGYLSKALLPGAMIGIVDDFWELEGIPSPALRDGWGISELRTVEQLTTALEQAGLRVVDVRDLTSIVVQVSPRTIRVSRLLVSGLKRAWPSRAVLWRFYAAQLHLQQALADGQLRYAFVMAQKVP